MPVLSVDLGASNTVAVLSAHGRPPRAVEVDGSTGMPSAVFAEEGGGLVVGRDAQRRARLDPTRFEANPKRRVDEQRMVLGDDAVGVDEALAAVLRRVLDETTRQLGGEYPEQVRLTHPAQWGTERQNVLLSAARLAGLGNTVALVPEPVAAAAHFASFPGRGLAEGQALAVYDLGAATFDVAVVGASRQGYTVLAEDGLPDLGGLDIDQALLVHLGRQVSHHAPQQWQRMLRPESTSDRRSRRALRDDVTAAKEALSRYPQTQVLLPEPFPDVLVTRDELEGLVRPAMLRSVELLGAALREAGMSPAALAGIYLVGGSSRLPPVASMISEKIGVSPSSLDQPETAVAYGAHHVSADGITTGSGQAPPTVTNIPPVPARAPSPGPAGGADGAPGAPAYPPYRAGNTPTGHPGRVPPTGQDSGRRAARGSGRTSGRRTKIIVGAATLVVLLVVGTTVLLTSQGSVTTHAVGECAEPGTPGDDGFTGCLRQLAGSVADSGQCEPGVGTGLTAGARELGVAVTCPTPGLSGGRVTYVHGRSTGMLKRYAGQLLNSTGGELRVRAKWKGNALTGHYVAESGGQSAVLVFRVADRPLAGFVYQLDLRGSGTIRSASRLADYFENRIQPGT